MPIRFDGKLHQVDIQQADRAEFFRDAQAAVRIGSRWAARAFLINLCRTRARVELYDQLRDRRITQDDFNHLHHPLSVELYRECERMGFAQPRITSIETRTTFEYP